MSKNHFELDREAKKALSTKCERPEAFGGAVTTTEETTTETTTEAPAAEEEIAEVPEYPLNEE